MIRKVLPLFVISLFLLSTSASHAQQTPTLGGLKFCTPPASGQTWTLSADCVLYEDYNGPIDANMTIQAGVTMTLHPGKHLIWYPNKSITIETGASIIVNTNSEITQKPLCVNTVDIGGSKYALGRNATLPEEYGSGTVYLGLDQQSPATATSACSTLGAGYIDASGLTSRDYISLSGTPTDTSFLASSYRYLLNLGMAVSSINSGVKSVQAASNTVSVVGDNLQICTGPTSCSLTPPVDYGNLIVEGDRKSVV